MQVIESIQELRTQLQPLKQEGKNIGFVPTMGALHEGHFSLIKASISECQVTVVSIFLNPTQFDDQGDFENYPKNNADDLNKLDDLEHVDFVFLPKVDDIYPPGCDLSVNPGNLSDKLCGISRAGHFRGVLTVVLKLFNMVQPDTAFFGAKDFQQCVLISKMVTDFNIPVDIRMIPTVREENGLAMSSRNKHLSMGEFEEASLIFQTLERGKIMIQKGETNALKVLEFMITSLIEYGCFEVDYLVIVDPLNLEDLTEVSKDKPYCIATAVYMGKTRLIDNLLNIPNQVK